MNRQLRPADVALAYLEAFARHDMATAARYIAGDIAFESPRAKLSGAVAYLDAVGQFAQAVTGVDTIAAFGDDDRATDATRNTRFAAPVTTSPLASPGDRLIALLGRHP